MATFLSATAIAGSGSSPSIDTTGATLIAVAVANNTTEGVVTDSQSNTWSYGSTAGDGYGRRFRIAYCINPLTSASHTFAGGDSASASISVAAFSGVTSFDQEAFNSGNGNGTYNPIQAGSVTPANANNLIISGCGEDILSPYSIDSGFTIAASVDGSTSFGSVIAYLDQTAATAQNPSWTLGTVAWTSAAVNLVFNTSAAGATGQFAKPISDYSVGSWKNEAGSGTNLYASIDEDVKSATDFVMSSFNPVSDVLVIKLGSVSDPSVNTGHILHYEYFNKSASASFPVNLQVELLQGTSTVVALWTHSSIGSGTFQADQTLTGVQADSITDYSNLYLRFTASV